MDADGYGLVDRPKSHVAADGGLAIEGRRGLRGVRRFSHEAMATMFEVHAVHPDARYAAQAAQAAFDLTDRLERELSRFIPNSDIGRINSLAAGEGTRVGPSTLECLVIARHVFNLTDGAFDISIGTGLPSLELDPDAFLVRATRSGVRIDLGGIGKGYAVDLMAELLEEWGLARALVHGGFSSVFALEAPADHDGWPLTLTDPGAPSRRLARLSVRQTALGASGLRKGDHIVDPRTGEPALGRRAAWVAVPRPAAVAPEVRADDGPRLAAAAVADALTTAFMVLSPEEVEALCRQSPGLEAWILEEPAAGQAGEASLLHFGGSGAVPRRMEAGSSDPA
jgi:thiamine biosynthesis lipoprotein